jgi:Effector-associated domain 10/NACHT domain/Ribosomal protein L7/L12 C-terminal domain
MANPSNPNEILQRILDRTQTDTDVEDLRQLLSNGGVQNLQFVGKYNANIAEGQDIQIGEVVRVVTQGSNAEDIRAVVRSILKEELPKPQVDDLVQQVRNRLHERIQSLHGTIRLWGIDRWVPVVDLFVDVNILEEVSSSRRSELDDLWQDFITNNSDERSLDRIGLGEKRQRVSGLTVLERDRNLMVVGKPGAGKTTYLQSIVTECNDGKLQSQRIPVLIKLREFIDDGRKFEYNLERFLEQLWQLSSSDLKLVLDRGLALVLLDGLDEVVGEVGKQINREIKRFARVYPQSQLVITCRTQSQTSRFERFDYVELADFNEQQVEIFAIHWFRGVYSNKEEGEAKAQEFLSLLFRAESNAIRTITITPILLSLTCAVFHQTGKFYTKRSKLYEEGLDLLLKSWDKSREVEGDKIYRDLSVDRKLELLSYIAVKKFEQDRYVLFDRKELEGYIGEILGIERLESQMVLREIESQHGLLVERAENVWSFSHLTFQEYLSARWFVDRDELEALSKHVVSNYYDDPSHCDINTFTNHWNEVILITSELRSDADNFLGFMKTHADNLIRNDLHLQNFLNWIFEKSLATQSNLKMCAIRAFYFALTCGAEITIEDYYDLGSNFYIDRTIEKAIFFHDTCCHEEFELLADYLLYIAFNESMGADLVFRWGDLADELIMISDEKPRMYGRRYTSYLWDCINFNEGRSSFEEIFYRHNFDKWLQKYYPETIFHKAIFQIIQAPIQHRADSHAMFEAEYNNEAVYEKVHEFSSSWWDRNQTKLSDDLRSILIRHRNIAHDWQFNGLQTRNLHLYYEANLLIVKCLKRCNVNLQVKKEIENTLLLPLAEIERIKGGITKVSEDSKISKATINKLIHKIDKLQFSADRSYTLKDAIYQLIPSIASLQDQGYKLADISAYLSENGVAISYLTLGQYLDEIQHEAWLIRREDEPSCPGFPDLEPNLQFGKIPAFEASEYYQVIFHHLSNESLEVKTAVLRVVWRVSGIGIGDAKNIIESGNVVISGVHKIVAEYVKYKLEKAGGIASIEKTDNLADIPRNERFLPDFIDEIEFYEVLTTEQKQEWKNRCIFASERRKLVKKLYSEFLESRKN